MSNHNLEHYVLWRKNRIQKLVSILGENFFVRRTILELGCGRGDIGKYFIENYNSEVTFAEGREKLVHITRENNPGYRVCKINQEEDWNIRDKFGLIIHWGVLYHLDNWQQDLECTVRHLKTAGILALESEILCGDGEIKLKEDLGLDDQSLSGIGTRPSATKVENKLESLGLKYIRYDDADLNSGAHHYDWNFVNSGHFQHGQRRFWIARR